MKKDTHKRDKEADNQQEKVDVNFESHPPIADDLDGITSLIRQTFLHFIDCNVLAKHLIELKDITQVIALECDDDDDDGENQSGEDEPDNDIYGVTSRVELKTKRHQTSSLESAEWDKLSKFLVDKCQQLDELLKQQATRVAVIINERYINLPPQLSLPTLKNLTPHLKELTHVVFVSKVQLKARHTDTSLPSKKSKQSSASAKDCEPIIYTNPEEEIIFENCDFHTDIDVSSHCDENATWSATSDVKYTPHRRIMVVDFKKWPSILESLRKELQC